MELRCVKNYFFAKKGSCTQTFLPTNRIKKINKPKVVT